MQEMHWQRRQEVDGMLQITPIKDSTNQSLTLTLEMGEVAKRVNLLLEFKGKRWYMSLSDVQTGEIYFTFVPLVATSVEEANNLWFPFWYKDVGMFFCIPIGDEVKDPAEDNLDQYYLVWSDGNG